MFDLEKITRACIRELVPYSSARDEYKGTAGIFLDANENSFGSPVTGDYSRYPDPLQTEVKKKVGELKGISAEKIFLGNGSDEAIDLLFRVFCEARRDNVIICPPTYGMYRVAANINGIEVREVILTADDFQADLEGISKKIDPDTKLIFLCSPNNPTGSLIDPADIFALLKMFNGIVVVDEAYIDFAPGCSLLPELDNYENLVILQTFSKGWGMAGLRVGLAFASEKIIRLFNKVKYPYNINAVSQRILLDALDNSAGMLDTVAKITRERERISGRLKQLELVLKVYPSEANFLLVQVLEPKKVYDYLADNRVVVRDRSGTERCENCLRITIGTAEENNKLIQLLEKI
jgi:histidinol-phosphate aminotransferase